VKQKDDRKTKNNGKSPAKQYQNEHNFRLCFKSGPAFGLFDQSLHSAIGMGFRIQQERRNSFQKTLLVGHSASPGALKFFMEV
jgi:hypothetical protein